MLILGLDKTTLLDYPGRVSATIFTGGCNFRCPYCHNKGLVICESGSEAIPTEDIMAFLSKRKNILGGVCISGGEPTLQEDIVDFIERIYDLGYDIKLDTNGSKPDVVSRLINKGLLKYIAMDIKNSFDKYEETTGCDNCQIDKIKQSVQILLEGKVEYEFRTTVVKELHTVKELTEIESAIAGGSRWYIQSYVDSPNVIKRGYSAYNKEELEMMVKGISKIPVFLRGVD